jgi:hypothetical protein
MRGDQSDPRGRLEEAKASVAQSRAQAQANRISSPEIEVPK